MVDRECSTVRAEFEREQWRISLVLESSSCLDNNCLLTLSVVTNLLVTLSGWSLTTDSTHVSFDHCDVWPRIQELFWRILLPWIYSEFRQTSFIRWASSSFFDISMARNPARCVCDLSPHPCTHSVTQGISLQTQVLYLIVYSCRYFDIFWNFWSLYNWVMKCIFITTSVIAVCLIKFQHYPIDKRYNPKLDGFKAWILLIPTFILALFFNVAFTPFEIVWAFSIFLEVMTWQNPESWSYPLPLFYTVPSIELNNATLRPFPSRHGHMLCYAIRYVSHASS